MSVEALDVVFRRGFAQLFCRSSIVATGCSLRHLDTIVYAHLPADAFPDPRRANADRSLSRLCSFCYSFRDVLDGSSRAAIIRNDGRAAEERPTAASVTNVPRSLAAQRRSFPPHDARCHLSRIAADLLRCPRDHVRPSAASPVPRAATRGRTVRVIYAMHEWTTNCGSIRGNHTPL